MKHIKSFNETVEPQAKPVAAQSDYDPARGRGHSYKENLGRADNKEVYKILPEIEKLVGADVTALVKKIEDAIRSGKMEDTDTRNIAVAIGDLVYNTCN